MLKEAVAADGRFEELFRRLHGPTLALALRVLGDRGDAEEATQEAFLRLWPRWRRR